MPNESPASRDVFFTGNSKYGERLTLVAGRNAVDGTLFDPAAIGVDELMRGRFVAHEGAPERGSLVARDGRHVEVPALVGLAVHVAGRAAGAGGFLATAGTFGTAVHVATGGNPAAAFGVLATGVAVKLIAMAVGDGGRGTVERCVMEARARVADLQAGLDRERAANDVAARSLEAAMVERIAAARARRDLDGGTGMVPG